MAEIDPSICPICGLPNTCGAVQGKSACWCMGVEISAEALARIPLEAKDLACICPRCAAAQAEAKSG